MVLAALASAIAGGRNRHCEPCCKIVGSEETRMLSQNNSDTLALRGNWTSSNFMSVYQRLGNENRWTQSVLRYIDSCNYYEDQFRPSASQLGLAK